jgi:hypothetical protein
MANIDKTTAAEDAAWFLERPESDFRIRPMIPGEAPGVSDLAASLALVLVFQIAPGIRVKIGTYAEEISDLLSYLRENRDGLRRTLEWGY